MYKKVEYLNQVKAGGQVTANVVSNGDLTTSESYTYDDRGRLLTHSLSTGKSTSYAYGNRKDTVTVNNRRYIKTYDAWGNVKTSTDPVSSVSYVYSSVGKPKQAASAGATFSMTYDSQGRQTTLTDPDAGTETYEYDVLGRIIKQTDAKGKVTENDYDAFGKILSTTIDGIATTYDYDSYHRLEKETREGTSVSYTYDDYNRVKTESRTIDASNTLGFTYNYNAQGLLQSTVYPGNVTVGYAYDGYGNLASVTAGNTKVWEFASNNGLRYTATLGGTLTSVEERNSQGLLTSQRMLKGSTLLHNMGYTFNGSTGNLTSRSGMLSQTETFGYDNVDRLTSVQHGSTTAMTLTYGANGNITSKTGIGTYSYGTKPHAVTGVTNSGSLIDSNTQNITYTAFDKAASISQGNYQLDITYGTDLQRWKSVLKNNGTVTRTTLYAGDYEKVTENGVTKQYYYLHGGNGLAALYVKQSNASDKVYYPCTDHLGSIMKLVDANGIESFKATYDAWGQQTVTTNTLNFYRGYTGHEHLSQFALINMNGRMYDPLLGRFLSPDPFVQLPDFSQNFNRYSYCLNNPLVYVDPDGEFIIGYTLGFIRGLFSKNPLNAFKEGFKGGMNELKIYGGLFTGNAGQIASRFTWELPQTILGVTWSLTRNALGKVDQVEYFDGATFVINENTSKSNGVTLGSYINIDDRESMPKDNNGRFTPTHDYLYMHEYGHYLQSQDYGWGYLFSVGIKSLFSAMSSKKLSSELTTHKVKWYEIDANKRAFKYFEKHYGIEKWKDSKYPLNYPEWLK